MYILYAAVIHVLSVLLGWFMASSYGYHEGTTEYGNMMMAFVLGGFVVIIVVIAALYLNSGSTVSSVDNGRYK